MDSPNSEPTARHGERRGHQPLEKSVLSLSAGSVMINFIISLIPDRGCQPREQQSHFHIRWKTQPPYKMHYEYGLDVSFLNWTGVLPVLLSVATNRRERNSTSFVLQRFTRRRFLEVSLFLVVIIPLLDSQFFRFFIFNVTTGWWKKTGGIYLHAELLFCLMASSDTNVSIK